MILEKIMIGVGLLLAHFLNGSALFEIGGYKPDFMMILVLFFALRKGGLFGLWIGFFGGLLTDSGLGGETEIDNEVYYKIGLHTLSYSLTGYIVGKFTRSAYNENYLSITIYVLVFTFLSRVFVYLLFILFFHSNDSYSLIATSLYTAILGPLFFFILTWSYKLSPTEGEL